MGTRRSQEDKDEIDRLALELASARNCRSAWQDLANTLRGELNEAKAEIERLRRTPRVGDGDWHDHVSIHTEYFNELKAEAAAWAKFRAAMKELP